MSDFFNGIMEGLNEAIAYAQGKPVNVIVHKLGIEDLKTFTPDEIKEIRHAAKMTQGIFAACIGVSVKTIEAWEGGRSKPDGAARRTLGLMQKNPKFADEVGIIIR